MIQILVLAMFLLAFAYNVHLKRKVTHRAKQSPLVWGVVGSFAMIALYMAHRLNPTVMGYVVAISSILLICSVAFAQGAGPDGIVVLLGLTPLLRKISWQEVTSLESTPIKNTHDLELKVKAHGDEYKQRYAQSDWEVLWNELSDSNFLGFKDIAVETD